jgi:hypothetical protein
MNTMKKTPDWLFKIGLSLISVLFCFLILEFVFRMMVPDPDNMLLTDRSKTYFKPQMTKNHLSVKEATEIIDIGVIGDSFAQGAAVQEIDRFSRKLEYMLNLNDINSSIRVNNYARSGSSTYQQLEQLDMALANNDDIVILQITLNDTEDWNDPNTIFEWRKEIIPSTPAKWMRPIVNNSRLLAFGYTKYASLKSQAAFIQYYKNLYDPEYSGWKRFVSAISTFKERCEETDTSFIVVIFPLFSHNLDEQVYPFKEMHQKIQKQLDGNAIQYIDLYDIFKNMLHVRLEAIPGIDPHPNEIAHRIAAEEILEFLMAQALLDKKYYPKVKHSDAHKHWQKTYERMRLIQN